MEINQWWKKAKKEWQIIEDKESIIGIFGLDPLEKVVGRITYKHDKDHGPGWLASARALKHDLKSAQSFHPEQESSLDKAFHEAIIAVQGRFAVVGGQVQQIEAKQREAEQIVTDFLARIKKSNTPDKTSKGAAQ